MSTGLIIRHIPWRNPGNRACEIMRLSLVRQRVKWGEVTQSCLTLCHPMDCSLLGSSVHGIFQARILKWVAMRHETFKPKQLSLRSNVDLASLYLPSKLWQRMSEAPLPYFLLNRLSVTCGHLVSLNEPESETVSRSVVSDSATLWTVAHQAPLSKKSSR